MAAKPKAASKSRVARALPNPVSGYYTEQTYTAEDSVGFLTASLRTRMFKAVDLEMAKLGFTSAQWPILRLVATGATPTAADLCRQLNYDTGSMTRMLDRLERKGVVMRKPSAEDRRVVRLHMTPAGRKLYPKLREVIIRVLNHLTSDFSPDEVQVANRLLQRMRDNLVRAYGPDL